MPAFGKKDKAGGGIGAMGGTDSQLNDDIKQLEDYERQSKLADAQRTHLKVCVYCMRGRKWGGGHIALVEKQSIFVCTFICGDACVSS